MSENENPGQSPVARSPVAQSPVAQSPVGQSPVARSPIAQSPIALKVQWRPRADAVAEVSPTAIVTWLRSHQVLVAGLLLIAAEIIWKAQLLHHLYFYQDDYVDLDIARKSAFSWHYLTLVSDGHFFIGLRAITWVLARISLYNWGLDSTILLALAAGAGVAALRVLRTLFGDRKVILILLACYVLSPLTVPDLGWWWAGMESVPLQLAIFMALNAHVLYVRSGGTRHLVAACSWLVFGMLFFDKAAFLPVLLFAVTSAFLMGTKSWLGGALSTLRRHWRAWLAYAVLVLGYGVLYVTAYRASVAQSRPAKSASGVWTFVSVFVKDTLIPGAVGGPWAWLPAGPGHVYAIAQPPAGTVLLAGLVAVAVVVVSIWIRAVAWRAWLTFAIWLVLADIVPVIAGRLGFGLYTLFGLETRYLADAVPVLAICVGLAFWPVVGEIQQEPAVRDHRKKQDAVGQGLRYAAAALVGVFAVGSIWSNQAYETITSGAVRSADYMANAEQAVTRAARGTVVLDNRVPDPMVMPLFGAFAYQSQVIGSLDTGTRVAKLRWISQPRGTIDSLKMFGGDGRLYPALISGVYTVPRRGPGLKVCWPDRSGQIKVSFPRLTAAYDPTLFISYIWDGGPASFTVEYGDAMQRINVRTGVNNVYLPVTGSVKGFSIFGDALSGLCVGRAEAGTLVPY
jgi:hypothetical protein